MMLRHTLKESINEWLLQPLKETLNEWFLQTIEINIEGTNQWQNEFCTFSDNCLLNEWVLQPLG